MKTRRLFVALLVLVWSASGYAQTLDTAKLDLLFDRLLDKNKAMGGLTIARDGEVVYSRSFGFRLIDDTQRQPLNADTRYRISSITKTYTAVMVFQLVEERRLTLIDTLDRWFPQIPNASRITIAQLLSHRSGIPDISVEGFYAQPRSQVEIVAQIAKGTPHFEPDTTARYSNLGYNLLGFIVEKVGGKAYPDALRDRIAVRLGLRSTYAGTGLGDPRKNESLSYRYQGGWQYAPEPDLSVVGAAGGIVSTPADMAAFIKGLFDLKLVSRENLTRMMTMRDGEGMGLLLQPFAGRTCYGYTGGSNTSGAWLTYCPEEKLALAYGTNAKVYPVRDIIAGVFDIYWGRPFQVPSFEAFQVSTDVLDRYVGIYSIPGTPARMRVIRDGGTLFIQPTEESRAPLEATAVDKFQIAYGVTVEFDTAKDQMTIKRPQGERVFTKEKEHMTSSVANSVKTFTLIALGLATAVFATSCTRAGTEAAPLFPQPSDVPSVSAAAPSPPWTATVDRARSMVRAAIVEQNLPGVSIAVGVGAGTGGGPGNPGNPGNIVWAEGFGWRDVATRAPVTPATRFNIGTAASAVPAAAVASLGMTNTGTDSAAEWSPGHIGEPEEDPPPFTFVHDRIFRPIGLADPAQPLPGDRATFYVPRSDDHNPRRGRRLMYMRDLACCAKGMAFYSTPTDLVRFALATKAASVNGELAGGSVMSLMSRRDDKIIVAVASNIAYANTAALAQKVADMFAGQE